MEPFWWCWFNILLKVFHVTFNYLMMEKPRISLKLLINFTWIKVVSYFFKVLTVSLKITKYIRTSVFALLITKKKERNEMYHSLGCCHCLSFLVDNYYLKSMVQIINDSRNFTDLWNLYWCISYKCFAINIDLNNSNRQIYLENDIQMQKQQVLSELWRCL